MPLIKLLNPRAAEVRWTMTEEEAQQLASSLRINSNNVHPPHPLDSLPPPHTFSANAQWALTTQKENVGVRRYTADVYCNTHPYK